jgi:hypothetical protein
MNIIYLSPHFPPNYQLFPIRLREFGANVLGLADEPYERLSWQLKQSMTEYFHVPDMHNYDDLIRAVGYFTHRYGKIDRIDSLNEYWLETEASLRTDFNIPGIKLDQIEKIKRKSKMKRVFKRAGITVARGAIIRTDSDAYKFVNDNGFPVVAKPDIGVGAAKTYRIDTDSDLEFFLQDRPPVDYFMEEFVDGIIQTFDGLTDREGNIVFYTSHQYSKGIMETVNEDDDIYYYSLRDIPDDLDEAGFATVNAFGVRERFFHFEFFRTPDNQIVALEVNIRPPGGLTTDMFNYANDIDIYYQWANILVNNSFDAEYSRPYHCCYVGRKLNKHYKYTQNDIYANFGPYIVHHEPISGIFSGALGNHGYLIRSPDLDEIIEIANFIQEKR